jgi:DNA-binding MarR family transcriptional regulator
MAQAVPLTTLLSHALVAFTIELDNEFEVRMPHRTTATKPPPGTRGAPWLTSLVMYSNFMRLVPEEGIPARELQKQARVPGLPFHGMRRWRYVDIDANRVVRPTVMGRKAQAIWRPLFGVIEERWEARFGKEAIGRLRESLSAIVNQFDIELPEYLPVVGYGLFTPVSNPGPRTPGGSDAMTLAALLSKVLLVPTIEFERDRGLSLPVYADVVRLLGEEGVRVRDLPRLSGVSKEGISMALGFLKARGYTLVEPGTKLVRLTSKGLAAQKAYRSKLQQIEKSCWSPQLRETLHPLTMDKLFEGIEPPPGCWRASVRKPETLPHFPMVLHRGGYPDGS